MPRLAIILPVAAIAFALAGCDPAVQARYHPTTVDEAYGMFSHVGGVEGQVYELPADPPALDGAAIRPRSCLPTGQRFQPIAMFGMREEPHSYQTLTPVVLAGMHDEPLPSPRPGKALPLYGWQPALEPGIKEPLGRPDFKATIEPGHSLYRAEPVPLSAWRRDTWSSCDEAANLR